MRRYSTARSPSHESNTARIAWRQLLARVLREVLAGLVAEDLLEARRSSAFRSSTSSSVSSSTPASRLRSAIASSIARPGCRGRRCRTSARSGGRSPRRSARCPSRGEPSTDSSFRPEVEDRVEHPRHRLARAASARTPAAGRRSRRASCRPAPRGARAPRRPGRRARPGTERVGLHVGHARLGGDREAGRHALGAEHARHLGDVGALAAEQVAHVARALGEVVDELRARGGLHAGQYALGDAPQSHVRVVLERLGDRPVGLRQRRLRAPAGASASGLASAVTRKRCASSPSGNEPASQPAQTTPPALGEKPPRCSASPQAAHDGQLGREARRQQQLEAERERLGAAGGRGARRRAAPARGRAGCRRAGWTRSSRAAAAPPRRPGWRARARRAARAGPRGRAACRPG